MRSTMMIGAMSAILGLGVGMAVSPNLAQEEHIEAHPRPKRRILVGTTSHDIPTIDRSGRRRYWPEQVTKSDVERVQDAQTKRRRKADKLRRQEQDALTRG